MVKIKTSIAFFMCITSIQAVYTMEQPRSTENKGRIRLDTDADLQVYLNLLQTALANNDSKTVSSLYGRAFGIQHINEDNYKQSALETIYKKAPTASLEMLTSLQHIFEKTVYEEGIKNLIEMKLHEEARKHQEEIDASVTAFISHLESLKQRLETIDKLDDAGLIRLQQDIDYAIALFYDGFKKNSEIPQDAKNLVTQDLQKFYTELMSYNKHFSEQLSKLAQLFPSKENSQNTTKSIVSSPHRPTPDKDDNKNNVKPTTSSRSHSSYVTQPTQIGRQDSKGKKRAETVPMNYLEENEELLRTVQNAIEKKDKDFLEDLKRGLDPDGLLIKMTMRGLEQIEREKQRNKALIKKAPKKESCPTLPMPKIRASGTF